MRLALCVATMQQSFNGSEYPGYIPTWKTHAVTNPPVWFWKNTSENNLGVIGTYSKLYEDSKRMDFDILAYIHDDVICREQGWDRRVLDEFEDPKVGVVGFGGGLRHGSRDIYKTPYRLQQLARSGYLSNVDDAESHGTRFGGSRDVAVVDGFGLVIRRVLLDRCGGWHPDRWPPHHCYDYRICCESHRYGYRVRLVGVRCHHRGGATAVRADYQAWAAKTKWGSDAGMHEAGHKLIYDEFKDVLPWTCE